MNKLIIYCLIFLISINLSYAITTSCSANPFILTCPPVEGMNITNYYNVTSNNVTNIYGSSNSTWEGNYSNITSSTCIGGNYSQGINTATGQLICKEEAGAADLSLYYTKLQINALGFFNSITNLTSLGFNTTIQLKDYFDTLYVGGANYYTKNDIGAFGFYNSPDNLTALGIVNGTNGINGTNGVNGTDGLNGSNTWDANYSTGFINNISNMVNKSKTIYNCSSGQYLSGYNMTGTNYTLQCSTPVASYNDDDSNVTMLMTNSSLYYQFLFNNTFQLISNNLWNRTGTYTYLANNDNVGIGTTAPTSKLYVNGNATISGAYIDTNTPILKVEGDTGSVIGMYVDGTLKGKMRVDSTGGMGIESSGTGSVDFNYAGGSGGVTFWNGGGVPLVNVYNNGNVTASGKLSASEITTKDIYVNATIYLNKTNSPMWRTYINESDNSLVTEYI